MQGINDLINRRVRIITRELEPILGTLLSIDNGGYFVKTNDEDYTFVPEQNNVMCVDYNRTEKYKEDEEES
jgi:hypothetical protein